MISEELKLTLYSVIRVVLIIVGLVMLLTALSVLLNKEVKKDYSDQDGYKNFRKYTLGFIMMLLVVFVTGYLLFFGGIL